MKLKGIFILLNGVLAAAFLVIFLLPLLLIGADWFSLFWSRNWPIALAFIAALGIVDCYFLLNWRLFRGLEKEDWPAVAAFLEEKIYRQGWAFSFHARMLLNTYLLTSNIESIRALEAYFVKRKPRLIGKFSLSFGIPHLLAKDPKDPEAFFSALLESAHVANREWVRWNRAFSLLQLKEEDRARAELLSLADSRLEPVLLLLSLYLLDVLAKGDDSLGKRVAKERESLRGRFTQEAFGRTIEAAAGNMEVVILSRLVQDATQWLFAAPASIAPTAEKTSAR